MKTFLRLFEIVCVALWLAGMFAPDDLKATLWSFPAGFGVGLIVTRFILKARNDRGKKVLIKEISFNSKDASPELKLALDELLKAASASSGVKNLSKEELQAVLGDQDQHKCDNPHCPGCWGL